MPKTTFHTRLNSAPKQDTLPHVRRSTRRRRTTAPAAPLLREQTLTQIDFVRSSSNQSHNHSDDGDDDFDEHMEKPPKKKRKKNVKGRSASQTTMTQNWRNCAQMYRGDERTIGPSDGEEFDVPLDDEDPGLDSQKCHKVHTNNDVATADMDGQKVLSSHSATAVQGLHGETFDYAEHLLSVTGSARSSKALHSGFSDIEVASTRPTSAGSATAFTTPRKTRRTVVPSSQTPSSLQLSRHKEYDKIPQQQSPLQERSSNITRTHQCSPIRLKKRDCQTQKLFETLGQEGEGSMINAAWSAKPTFTPSKLSELVDRPLRRATTIQDSQDDDFDLISSGTSSATEAHKERLRISPNSQPLRSLKRTTTVQESQADSDMEELEAESKQYEYDPMFQQTFDPVVAALDRDATRFGRSHTQLTVRLGSEEPEDNAGPETQFIMSTQLEHSHSCEGSVGLGSGPPSRDQVEIVKDGVVPSSARATQHTGLASECPPSRPDSGSEEDELPQSATTIALTQERCGDEVRFSPYLRALDQNVGADGVVENSPASSLHSQLAFESQPLFDLPSQSEEIHQSQISTVMPTQRSRHSSAYRNQFTQLQSIPAIAINTLSSSPFPLPPRDWNGASPTPETQDFSLPPPPQFSSQNRQSSGIS